MKSDSGCRSPCQCCEKCANAGFQKLLELLDDGFVIYRYREQCDNVHKDVNVNVDEDVFIFHNKKDGEIKKDDINNAIGQHTPICPRCRKIFEQIQKLTKQVPPINKQMIIGICNHCKNRNETFKNLCKCKVVTKKYIKIEQIELKKIPKSEKQLVYDRRTKLQTKIEEDSQSDKALLELLNTQDWKEIKHVKHDVDQKLKIDKLCPSEINSLTSCETVDSTKLQEKPKLIQYSDENLFNQSVEDSLYLNSDIGFIYCFPKEKTKQETSFDVSSTELIRKTRKTYHDKIVKEKLIKDKLIEEKLMKKKLKEDNKIEKNKLTIKDSQLTSKKILGKESYSERKESIHIIKKIASKGDVQKELSDTELKQKRGRHKDIGKSSLKEEVITRKSKERKETPNDEKERNISIEGKKRTSKKESLADQKTEKQQGTIKEDRDKIKVKETKEVQENKTDAKQRNDVITKEKIKDGTEITEKEKVDKAKNKVNEKEDKPFSNDKEKIKEEKLQEKGKPDVTALANDKEKNKAEKVQEKSKPDVTALANDKEKIKEEKVQEKGKPDDTALANEKEKSKEEKLKEKGKPDVTALANDKLKALLAQQAKLKEDNLKKIKQEEEQERKFKEAAEKKAAEMKDQNTEPKVGPNKKNIESASEQNEKPQTGDAKQNIRNLDIKEIKVKQLSTDDVIMNLVRVTDKPKRMSDIDIPPLQLLQTHKDHGNKHSSTCVLCRNSDLELEIESLHLRSKVDESKKNIIIGNKIYQYKSPLKVKNIEDNEILPMMYKKTFQETDIKEENTCVTETKKPSEVKIIDQEQGKGIIRYALSDRTFIDKGWTLLPTEKIVRKVNVYRMRPARPEFDWFAHNKHKGSMKYDSGERLAEFDDNGRGRCYYKNGKLALDYYDAEELNAQQRYVIYSNGEPDERGRCRPLTVLATFDHLGNGVVFDHTGKIRLKYNQTEGVILDRSLGPPSHWKWHTLNDPPVLQQVMIDNQFSHRDPDIVKLGGPPEEKFQPDNEEMLAIEFDNFVKEKSKKLSQKFKPFQIKMKALKINENFSLRVLDQATVYLLFHDDSINIKLNLGMVLDHKEIIDTDTSQLGEITTSIDILPARTDSVAVLQKQVDYAQHKERTRLERERRYRGPNSTFSFDNSKTRLSKPLRFPLIPPSTCTSTTNIASQYKCRCPYANNLYRNTRLI